AHFGFGQQIQPEQKLSPVLLSQVKAGKIPGTSKFVITVTGSDLPKEINGIQTDAKKIVEAGRTSFFTITVTTDELISKILTLPAVIFAEDGTRTAKEELQIANLDLAVNKINSVHNQFPQWNGDAVTVSVKENKPDTTDIDFAGRFLSTNLSSTTVNSHASIMATMIAGGGNTWHLGKGAAWGSIISSSSFAILLPDANSAFQQYNISVQNHSYGVGVESYYGADAAAYDASAVDNPSLLHTFSAGNSGTSSATTGTYSGIQGFANLTGSFKMAKNIITVGATDSFDLVASLSSKGPAHDGRVKPELVAVGEDGSSGAAALVSGVSLILQQQYKQMNGSMPANALVKAILLNSADDVGNAEVDYSNGYGSLNALNAVRTIQSGRYMNGSVANAGVQTFTIAVSAGIKKLKLTLVWNDPPATPNAINALVNDLDLELVYPFTGETWKPWVLNSFPHIDSLQQPASRKRDSLNNIEQITLENPAAGNYQFRVNGFNVSAGSQSFYIAYQFDSTDIFEWHFPTGSDFIFSSSSNTLRWKSSFPVSAGILEWSTDNGNNWQLIDNNVNLTNNYYRWNVPSAIATALLRMTIGANQFVSDAFTISTRTITGVGFNCPDSFLFYWNKIPGVNNYRVYRLGNRYLESMYVTADSIAVLAKSSNPSFHYAVAPLIGNMEGVRSYTFNYATQGVECYFRSFLASLVNNTARLDLLLGTLYNVNRIVLEKFDGNNYLTLQQLISPASLMFNFSDNLLKKGLNVYRIKLELAGGRVIYSQPETIYYFAGSEFIIYPNPVRQNQSLNILANISDNATLQVLNIYGQKIYELVIDDITEVVPTGRLSKGLYFFRIIREGEKDFIQKVIVQ
ncbi:MAG: T9SS type A sorting domain-containing protein, partial [Chitinophagaceae bacterium]